MPRFTIRLTDEITKKLDDMATRLGQSRSKMAELAVALYIDNELERMTIRGRGDVEICPQAADLLESVASYSGRSAEDVLTDALNDYARRGR